MGVSSPDTDPACFRALAARAWGWPEGEFEQRLLVAAMPSWARIPARVLARAIPGTFAGDLRVMRELGAATGYNAVTQLAREFAHPHRDPSFWRDTVGIRPQGRRVLELAKAVFIEPQRPRRPEAPPAGASDGG